MSTIQVRPTAGRVRLTVDEFAQMLDAGLFEGRHVQLLDGELYEVTKNPPHSFAVSALADALHRCCRGMNIRFERKNRSIPGPTGGPNPTSWLFGVPNGGMRLATRGPAILRLSSRFPTRPSRTGPRSSPAMPRLGSRFTGFSI